jgi:hypothetical protein
MDCNNGQFPRIIQFIPSELIFVKSKYLINRYLNQFYSNASIGLLKDEGLLHFSTHFQLYSLTVTQI